MLSKYKKYISITIAILVSLISFVILRNNEIIEIEEDEEIELQHIVLNEVVHSVFYTPQYVALANGYFEENGLKVELVTGNGADKSMTSLITGESHIILAGAESSMYLSVDEDAKEVVNFAQLTTRAGNFLIARDEVESFSWNDVRGKTIIGGRPGGMPQITLEYILKQNGIDPVNDVTIITNLDFTATAGAFSTGEYDYTVEFEPNATKIENEGYGKVVASLGVYGGEIPYTSYITTRKYADENEETLVKFLKALDQAMVFIEESSDEEIAKSIDIYFDNISQEELVKIINRYKNQNTWNSELYCDIDSYEKLQQILIEAGTLQGAVDLEKLIDNRFIDVLGGE